MWTNVPLQALEISTRRAATPKGRPSSRVPAVLFQGSMFSAEIFVLKVSHNIIILTSLTGSFLKISTASSHGTFVKSNQQVYKQSLTAIAFSARARYSTYKWMFSLFLFSARGESRLARVPGPDAPGSGKGNSRPLVTSLGRPPLVYSAQSASMLTSQSNCSRKKYLEMS